MGQEGLLLLATLVAFGVVTIVLYFLVIRSPNDAPEGPRGVPAANLNHSTNNRRTRTPDTRTAPANATATDPSSTSSSTIDKILVECATSPSHVAAASKGANNHVLVDGLVAFRHTQAAAHEQSKPDLAAQNRKERARILSRMLAIEGKSAESGPPVRGSTVVASVPLSEVACPKLRRVLYLFSTYYNLLLILVVPSGTAASDMEKATTELRGKESERLDEECLPPHRIVAASTTAGRIAFVRQLSKVEIMLDFDNEVKEQLTRFGYRVINYKRHVSDKGTSQLGMQLLST
jgi:hypothetical protein